MKLFARKIIHVSLPQALFWVGAGALIVIWGFVAFVGPGSIVFWEWTADSWRSVATGLTGWGLVIIAAQYCIAVR